MTNEHLSQMRALPAEIQAQKEEFIAEVDRYTHKLKRIQARSQAARRKPPTYAIDARMRRGDVTWNDVLLSKSEDPDVQAAQKWLEPRLRLLEQGVFEAGHGERSVREVFREIDAQVNAWDTRRPKNDRAGRNDG